MAEAHIKLLHELLEEDSRNTGKMMGYFTCLTCSSQCFHDTDVLEWLGHRYSEKCDFSLAREFYKVFFTLFYCNISSFIILVPSYIVLNFF